MNLLLFQSNIYFRTSSTQQSAVPQASVASSVVHVAQKACLAFQSKDSVTSQLKVCSQPMVMNMWSRR